MRDDRSDLQVPVRFPHTRSGVGSLPARAAALNHRAAFNSVHELQMRPTASILRWLDVPGTGAPEAGFEATTILVEGLSDLPTVVGDWEVTEVTVDGEDRKVKIRSFAFYGLPWAQSIEGDRIARVILTDKIDFRGDVYDVVSVDFHEQTGRCVVTATIAPVSEPT